MEDIVIRVVLGVAKLLVAPVERQISYLLESDTNFSNLDNGLDKLMLQMQTVQHNVEEAKRKGEEIEPSVNQWLSKVDEIIIDARKILEERNNAEQSCRLGLCACLMTIRTRFKLSKKAVKELEEVDNLQNEKFDKFSYLTVPELPWLTSDKGYESFESRKNNLKDILITLNDPNVSVIGIYGIGGVGKTQLVKEVARQAKKKKMFDTIVFAKVSESSETRKIQGEIADELGLEFREESEPGRARRLCERLKKETKILVILDDIWRSLDLEAVGIPYGDESDGHNICKLLFTSRSEDVLSRQMKCQKNFEIGLLTETEAWRLFKKMAGDCTENRQLKPVATDVAKECAGLPIAIVTISRALSNEKLFKWKDALLELKRPSSRNFAGIQEKVYLTIELSYNHLEHEELKSTFLLSSLIGYGYNAHIMDLFKYGMGLGLFQDINTLEEGRDRVYTLVQKLKAACLLSDGSFSECFSMHDVVRDVAMAIASRDHHVLAVRTEAVSWKWPQKDTLKNCTKISLSNINISEPPEELECPNLKFLFMKPKNSTFQIPENFFSGMRELRVLDLTGMELLSLPSSIQLLVNLQTLCLDQNKLGDISIIGKLKNLEILSFLESCIEQLPEELAQLTKLKLLDLTNCLELKVIPKNVLSRLSGLEELYMGKTSIKWEIGGLNSERSNASLDELKHLSNLTSLELFIEDAEITLPKGLFSRKLERYKIFIGENWDWFAKCQTSRTLKLKLNSNISMEDLKGVNNVEDLRLDELCGVESIVHELDEEGFSDLRHLRAQNSQYFLSIINSMELVSFDAFPLLESLTLHKLINLEKICGSQLTTQCFRKLRIIKVRKCHKLRNIFSFSTPGCLPQLQTIEVVECKNIVEIFTTGREDKVDEIVFDRLRSLTLKSLPQFTSVFCEAKRTSTLQNRENELTKDIFSGEIIPEDKPDPTTSLFNDKVIFSNLETLILSGINFESIWLNQLRAMSSCVENLKHLIVKDCNKLKYIFSSSMIRNLVQLQHLEISNCPLLEVIVAKQEGAEAEVCGFVFRQLNFLELCDLPELRAFYPGRHTSEWPALKKLNVYGCDKVQILASETENIPAYPPVQPLLFIEKVFPNLEDLTLTGKNITMILQGQLQEHLFCKIKCIQVVNDESTVFAHGLLERFYNLEKLKLKQDSYREIFTCREVEKDSGTIGQQESKLESKFLENIQSLDVQGCDSLIYLLPPSASFGHLTALEAWHCNGLQNLVTSSTARSLVCVKRMIIGKCKMMKEVVANDQGDDAEDEIIFSKLKILALEGLKSLTSFCSGNFALKFPSLIYLTVRKCPNMTIFFQGDLSTPELQEVWQSSSQGTEWFWEGDLNTTIKYLHAKLALFPKAENKEETDAAMAEEVQEEDDAETETSSEEEDEAETSEEKDEDDESCKADNTTI